MKTTTTTIATHQPAANPRHSSITRTAIRQCKQAPATALALLTALLTLCAAPAARALTWDTVSGDNPTITDGNGNWNTTAGNLVWNNNANPNVIWSQTSTTVGSQAAVFGSGTDGTVDQWTVTLASQMAATRRKCVFRCRSEPHTSHVSQHFCWCKVRLVEQVMP